MSRKKGNGQPQQQPQRGDSKLIATYSPSVKKERKLPDLLPWEEFLEQYIQEDEEWVFKVKTVIANKGGQSYLLLLQPYSSPRQVNALAKLKVIPDVAIAILRSKVEVLARWTGADFIFYKGDEPGSWERGRTAIGSPIWRWRTDELLDNF